jgi:hypothetical protein
MEIWGLTPRRYPSLLWHSSGTVLSNDARSNADPLNLGCYFSTIHHHLLSNMLLCLTASSYKMLLLHISQEDFTTSTMMQVAEPLFWHCDKILVCSSSVCSVTIITLQIKGTLNTWKKVFSVSRDGLRQYYSRDLSDLSKNKGTM